MVKPTKQFICKYIIPRSRRLSHQVAGSKQPLRRFYGEKLASVFPFPRPHLCGSLRHWVCPRENTNKEKPSVFHKTDGRMECFDALTVEFLAWPRLSQEIPSSGRRYCITNAWWCCSLGKPPNLSFVVPLKRIENRVLNRSKSWNDSPFWRNPKRNSYFLTGNHCT